MAILNGKRVDADQIDPAKHQFIGTWRPPRSPTVKETGYGIGICPCGLAHIYTDPQYAAQNEHTLGEHWRKGCFDEPQYVTIQGPPYYDRTSDTTFYRSGWKKPLERTRS